MEKRTLAESSRHAPALAEVAGRGWLAWTGGDGRLNLLG